MKDPLIDWLIDNQNKLYFYSLFLFFKQLASFYLCLSTLQIFSSSLSVCLHYFLSYFMLWVFFLHLYLCATRMPSIYGGQKKASGLEVQMFVNLGVFQYAIYVT